MQNVKKWGGERMKGGEWLWGSEAILSASVNKGIRKFIKNMNRPLKSFIKSQKENISLANTDFYRLLYGTVRQILWA